MIKCFNPDLVVVATVKKTPTNMYFYVQNGDPGQIFCHLNDGGRLAITPNGTFVFRPLQLKVPKVNEEIVIVRESNDPQSRGFGRASMWAPFGDWAFTMNAHTMFRAIAHDHRVGGKFNSNSKSEVTLIENRLSGIIQKFPKTDLNEPLGKSYSTSLGGKSLTYKVRWERQCPDGSWVECGDPRPVHIMK